ncbi:MAG: hypothetical protein MUP55_00570 [Candidatus Aenigmarchaeota archaeon]|nr:hypothetical protein [Candidatus Aenigmarchaeota archaeon]
MEEQLEEPEGAEWVKTDERKEPPEPFCAECGKKIDRQIAHVSIVLSEERLVDGVIVPFDASLIAFYHLECSPYKRATQTT